MTRSAPWRVARLILPVVLMVTVARCGGGDSPSAPSGPSDPGTPKTPVKHTVSVSVDGYGSGTVTSQPAGVSCAAGATSCSGSFDEGTSVTLTATPGSGMAFGGWSGGGCSGTGTCAMTVSADVTVGATFDDPQLAAQEVGSEGGTVVSKDGRVTLAIPAGALASATTITVKEVEHPALPAEIPDSSIERSYEFGPDGLVFQKPAIVQVLTSQVASDSVVAGQILFTVSADGTVELAGDESLVRSATSDSVWVQGKIEHFSLAVLQRGFVKVVSLAPAEAEVGVPVDVLVYAVNTQSGSSAVFFPGELLAARGTDRSSVFEPAAGRELTFTRDAYTPILASVASYACTKEGAATYTVDVTFDTRSAGRPHTYTLTPTHPVTCKTAPAPKTLETGVHDLPGVSQPADVGVVPCPRGSAQCAACPEGDPGCSNLFALAGEDASGVGLVGLWDPNLHAFLLKRAQAFYAFGLMVAQFVGPSGAPSAPAPLRAGEPAPSVLFAWGDGGYATFAAEGGTPFPDTPTEQRTDVRVDGAALTPAGDAVVFASRNLGVGFVTWDAAQGRFAVSNELIAEGQFFGDPIAAFINAPDAPVLVLARSSGSRLYLAQRNGAAPTVVATGLGSFVSGLKCLPPVCLVLPPGGTTAVPVFRFDGTATPQRAADLTLDFSPFNGALRATAGGGVAALLVGSAGSVDHVTEVEFSADGTVIRTLPVTIPAGCTDPYGPAYAPDGSGAAVVVSCLHSHNYFVTRSQIFTGR